MKFFKYITNTILWLVIMIIAVMGFFGIKHTLIAKDSYQQTQPPVPFAYLKGTYKGNIKGTWRRHYDETDVPYDGVDYNVNVYHDEQFEVYCGISELSNYKDLDQQYYTLNKVKLFGGAIKMSCDKNNGVSFTGHNSGKICDIYHPIAPNAHIRITFNTLYDVPEEQWDSFFTDFAKHIESQIPAEQMPNLEQICKELRKQHNSHTTE